MQKICNVKAKDFSSRRYIILLGMSWMLRLVCECFQGQNEVIMKIFWVLASRYLINNTINAWGFNIRFSCIIFFVNIEGKVIKLNISN